VSAGGGSPGLGWAGIVRLGLVQTALGAVVVLTTSTMNRVMVVELMLPASLPGVLVGLHYAVQLLRPRFGHGSDIGGRRTPWIVGGMGVLGLGGVGAALATAWMGSEPLAAVALAVIAFVLIGAGVGASGTSLLVLLAKRVDPGRRAAAATVVWLMMIAGFALTAGVAGHFLDPFSPARLVTVTAVVAAAAFLVTLLAVRNVEARSPPAASSAQFVPRGRERSFRQALAEVWAEPRARRFAVFVFVSMLAYSAQDLILEPFAGAVFALTPGQSTQLSGLQHAGVLAGMVLVALLARGARAARLPAFAIGGCLASGAALLALAAGGLSGPGWPLAPTVFVLGLANGAFAVAAIGSMMRLASAGRARREGVRMGLWGAAQAVAFGLGGLAGTIAVDASRAFLGAPAIAYGAVFAAEALLFFAAARLAAHVEEDARAIESNPAAGGAAAGALAEGRAS